MAGDDRVTGLDADPVDRDMEDDRERLRRARERVRRSLAAGDYAGLLDPGMERLLVAAARSAPDDMDREIGALRFVMARLLAEEEDVQKLATSAARLAGVIATVVRIHRARPGREPEDLLRTELLAALGDAGLGGEGPGVTGTGTDRGAAGPLDGVLADEEAGETGGWPGDRTGDEGGGTW